MNQEFLKKVFLRGQNSKEEKIKRINLLKCFSKKAKLSKEPIP
jgi:hypothetical protein